MTDTRLYKYPLQVPASLKDMAIVLASEDGVSLNQWSVAAVAQKIGGVETAETFLGKRATGAVEDGLARYLDRAPENAARSRGRVATRVVGILSGGVSRGMRPGRGLGSLTPRGLSRTTLRR